MQKIIKIEIIPIEIALTEPFVISKAAITHARNTVVKIYSSNGMYGVGECCPYPTIHGESPWGTVGFARDIAAMLIGEDPSQIRKLMSNMDKMMTGNAAVKCAFDLALYDLEAKTAELPLYKYLQGHRGKKIYTDNTVSMLEKEKMAEKALQFKEMGFPVLKVKLGARPSTQDIDRIVAIRKAIGDELPLRIDANQAWNYIEALRALSAMADMNIEHCEEPIMAGNISDQIRLNAASPVPVMADETVFNHRDALEVVSTHAADLINIKLGKSGGICQAMKIASITEAAGVYCQVGSFSESRVGISALVHFDMVWDHIIYHDLDAPLMLSEDPVIGGMKYGKDWEVTVDDSHGHGADFDPVFLKRFDKIEIS